MRETRKPEMALVVWSRTLPYTHRHGVSEFKSRIGRGARSHRQPAERQFRLTRGLLQAMHEAKQAVSSVTKNVLVLRDLDLLGPMG